MLLLGLEVSDKVGDGCRTRAHHFGVSEALVLSQRKVRGAESLHHGSGTLVVGGEADSRLGLGAICVITWRRISFDPSDHKSDHRRSWFWSMPSVDRDQALYTRKLTAM